MLLCETMWGENMISKKDLLLEMNISYGQLYRWKREGLIPDDWFIKQSVSTGQETFFKREDIIQRIETILELKDKYQLDELQHFLNPNIKDRKFRLKEVLAIDVIDPYITKKYCKNKEDLTIFDLIIIYIFSENQDVISYDDYISLDFSDISDMNSVFYILQMDQFYILVTSHPLVLDAKIKIYKRIRFEDISSMIAKQI